jgi:hypothetical protein
MGIKYLNRFFNEGAADSMRVVNMTELSGKSVAVDISIYMYKYAADDNLIQNMYLMLSIFRHYRITPIFIFDGKPPPEKNELLLKRRFDKKEAKEEYYKIQSILKNNVDIDENEKQELINNMDMLKRKFIYISKTDIENVKSLIRAHGATYYDAPGEADELCAMLTIKGKVWACLSEDMDMFVYGCPRVVRYFSLLNHTGVLYDMKRILENLGITQKELREICILSGTDYNCLNTQTSTTPNLYLTLKYFKKYHKEKTQLEFYEWLNLKTEYIQNNELLMKIYDIFDLNNNYSKIKIFENIKIINGPIKKDDIKKILKTDGFIFANV